MKHLLRGVALAVLIAAAAPALAAKPAPPGAPIIPPADPAAAKAAASPAAPPAASPAAPPAAAATATAVRHDRPMRHRIAWHRRHARRHHWPHRLRSDRVAEQLNVEELHRLTPRAGPSPPPRH